MKRILELSLITVASVALLVSCGKKKEVTGFEEDPCLKGAPDWVLNANARDELARMIEIRVKNMVKNFMQVTGVGDAETVDRVSAQVSKQVAYQTIRGSRQVALWRSPCGELFVLVSVDPDMVKDFIKTQVETSLKNEQALWQLYQAKKAYQELDREIEKEFKGAR